MSAEVLRGKTILVAEDDDDLREIIADVLRMHGATILDAENGTVGLRLYGQNQIDMVVSDVRMPNGDGLALLDGVRRSETNDKPFLFLSGYSDLTDEEAINRGADGIFAKPFDVHELVDAIASLMRLGSSKS